MGTLDLDQARAARSETLGEQHVLKFGGTEFHLPVEVPLEFANHAVKGNILEALQSLLGENQFPVFMESNPSMKDVEELMNGMAELYGMEVGESSASRHSLKNTSQPSRQTSLVSTNST